MQMAMFMKVNGKIIKHMDKELIFIIMDKLIKEIELMINKKDKVKKFGLIN